MTTTTTTFPQSQPDGLNHGFMQELQSSQMMQLDADSLERAIAAKIESVKNNQKIICAKFNRTNRYYGSVNIEITEQKIDTISLAVASRTLTKNMVVRELLDGSVDDVLFKNCTINSDQSKTALIVIKVAAKVSCLEDTMFLGPEFMKDAQKWPELSKSGQLIERQHYKHDIINPGVDMTAVFLVEAEKDSAGVPVLRKTVPHPEKLMMYCTVSLLVLYTNKWTTYMQKGKQSIGALLCQVDKSKAFHIQNMDHLVSSIQQRCIAFKHPEPMVQIRDKTPQPPTVIEKVIEKVVEKIVQVPSKKQAAQTALIAKATLDRMDAENETLLVMKDLIDPDDTPTQIEPKKAIRITTAATKRKVDDSDDDQDMHEEGNQTIVGSETTSMSTIAKKRRSCSKNSIKARETRINVQTEERSKSIVVHTENVSQLSQLQPPTVWVPYEQIQQYNTVLDADLYVLAVTQDRDAIYDYRMLSPKISSAGAYSTYSYQLFLRHRSREEEEQLQDPTHQEVLETLVKRQIQLRDQLFGAVPEADKKNAILNFLCCMTRRVKGDNCRKVREEIAVLVNKPVKQINNRYCSTLRDKVIADMISQTAGKKSKAAKKQESKQREKMVVRINSDDDFEDEDENDDDDNDDMDDNDQEELGNESQEEQHRENEQDHNDESQCEEVDEEDLAQDGAVTFVFSGKKKTIGMAGTKSATDRHKSYTDYMKKKKLERSTRP